MLDQKNISGACGWLDLCLWQIPYKKLFYRQAAAPGRSWHDHPFSVFQLGFCCGIGACIDGRVFCASIRFPAADKACFPSAVLALIDVLTGFWQMASSFWRLFWLRIQARYLQEVFCIVWYRLIFTETTQIINILIPNRIDFLQRYCIMASETEDYCVFETS